MAFRFASPTAVVSLSSLILHRHKQNKSLGVRSVAASLPLTAAACMHGIERKRVYTKRRECMEVIKRMNPHAVNLACMLYELENFLLEIYFRPTKVRFVNQSLVDNDDVF